MVQEETRKGPWTEQEDVQLVLWVNVYGDRRWDFIAKVSGLGWRETTNRYAYLGMAWYSKEQNLTTYFVVGLKRTGKSCRLRWVNYLHPGLKRGKMTPHEERLLLELHSKWGNRWSRIARKLPGRTDNEIKNYWRTHTRKKALERKKAAISPSSSSSSSSSSSFSKCSSSVSNGNSPTVESVPTTKTKERSFYDTGGLDMLTARGNKTIQEEEERSQKVYSMDEIWKDIEFSEDDAIQPVYDGYAEGGCNFSGQTMASPVWDYCPVSLWMMDEEESKMFPPISDQYYSFYNQESTTLTG